MKKLILTAVFVLAMAATAFAATREFTHFSADVPDGWNAVEQGGIVALVSPNGANVSVMVQPSGGMDAKSLATVMSQQLKGTTPKEENGGYAFTFKAPTGQEGTVHLFTKGDQFMMVTFSGDHPQLQQVVSSIKRK